MKRLLLLGVFLALGTTAQADLALETASFQSSIRVDAATGQVLAPRSLRAAFDVYNNIDAPAAGSSAISSTDLAAIWGDQVTTAGTGLLNEAGFTIYNSSTSAGPLLSASVAVDYYRASDSTYIGGFTTNPVTFGATGLAAGFFTTVNVTGLLPQAIDLDTTDLLVLQTVIASTGTADRLGVVSMNPINIGASPASMYIEAATIGGGAAGFYTLGTGVLANPGFIIAVPEPASLALLAFGGLALIRRR